MPINVAYALCPAKLCASRIAGRTPDAICSLSLAQYEIFKVGFTEYIIPQKQERPY